MWLRRSAHKLSVNANESIVAEHNLSLRDHAMKTLMTLLLAGGALLSVQGLTAKPAEAFGVCGWWGGGCCKTAVFYRPAACGCRQYRAVRCYRPRRCCR